jgi:hypothetical protein
MRIDWTNPLLWSRIDDVAVSVGFPWSPTEIVRQLQVQDPVTFASLRPQRISQWRDHAFPSELRWTDAHLRLVALGVMPDPSLGRQSVLVSVL